MKLRLMASAAALAALVGFPANSAKAELISYSFSSNDTLANQTGAGVIGSAGDQWMTDFVPLDIAGGVVETGIALTDVNGDPTSVTLAYNGLRRHNATGQAIDGNNPVPLQQSVYMRHNDDDPTYVFSGLVPGTTVDVVLFSTYHIDGSGINRGSSFTVDGNTLSTTGLGSRETLEEGRNYVLFDDIAVSPAGTLTVAIDGNNTGFSDVNGFQLQFTPVPEPSTVVLLALVVGSVGCYRRLV